LAIAGGVVRGSGQGYTEDILSVLKEGRVGSRLHDNIQQECSLVGSFDILEDEDGTSLEERVIESYVCPSVRPSILSFVLSCIHPSIYPSILLSQVRKNR